MCVFHLYVCVRVCFGVCLNVIIDLYCSMAWCMCSACVLGCLYYVQVGIVCAWVKSTVYFVLVCCTYWELLLKHVPSTARPKHIYVSQKTLVFSPIHRGRASDTDRAQITDQDRPSFWPGNPGHLAISMFNKWKSAALLWGVDFQFLGLARVGLRKGKIPQIIVLRHISAFVLGH